MFPPVVGLCLAFVLIPSHHWVQAPGPPTQLCQRFPEEGAQIWLGTLNYPSAPKAGQMCTAAAGSEIRNQLKCTQVWTFRFLQWTLAIWVFENLRYVWGIFEICGLLLVVAFGCCGSFLVIIRRPTSWLVHLQSAVTEHSTADARTNKSLMFWLPHICGQRQRPLCQRRYDCTTLQQAWWHTTTFRVVMDTEGIVCRNMII